MNASTIAAALLAAAVDAITDPPSRQVITVGSPRDPLQGEQVAVGWIRDYLGTPGTPAGTLEASCWGPIVAEFSVRVTRCVATSTGEQDTPPAELATAAAKVMDDAQAVLVALLGWSPHADEASDVWVGQPAGYQPAGFGVGFVIPVHVAT